jgi:hypothetical protein
MKTWLFVALATCGGFTLTSTAAHAAGATAAPVSNFAHQQAMTHLVNSRVTEFRSKMHSLPRQRPDDYNTPPPAGEPIVAQHWVDAQQVLDATQSKNTSPGTLAAALYKKLGRERALEVSREAVAHAHELNRKASLQKRRATDVVYDQFTGPAAENLRLVELIDKSVQKRARASK